MRLGIAADHGGFDLKESLAARLREGGYEVMDFGAHELSPEDDYPDFVIPLGQAVAARKLDRGVAVCGSGVGASVCANKIRGVRACLIEDHFSAKQGIEDDNINVICLGGRIEGPELAWDLVQTFLAAAFSQAPRHLRRLRQVAALENQKGQPERKGLRMPNDKTVKIAINTIRTLSMDAVQAVRTCILEYVNTRWA